MKTKIKKLFSNINKKLKNWWISYTDKFTYKMKNKGYSYKQLCIQYIYASWFLTLEFILIIIGLVIIIF